MIYGCLIKVVDKMSNNIVYIPTNHTAIQAQDWSGNVINLDCFTHRIGGSKRRLDMSNEGLYIYSAEMDGQKYWETNSMLHYSHIMP